MLNRCELFFQNVSFISSSCNYNFIFRLKHFFFFIVYAPKKFSVTTWEDMKSKAVVVNGLILPLVHEISGFQQMVKL